jgi:perosamine synthetase
VLPYGRQIIDDEDLQAVLRVLRSDWLTTGPMVGEFERAFATLVDAREAVAVSSGTAALHAAMYALGIGPGDEVIVPAMTFAATANCIVFQGGTPVFADVDPDTLLLDPSQVRKKITSRTKAVIAVDYAGQPCDYDALREVTDSQKIALVADACHAVGGSYKGRPVGSLAALNTFSFHPVKHFTTGEGGMITTDNPSWALRMRTFRNHGITSDHYQRAQNGSFFYEMVDLGYNYRITDFQSALGVSQLRNVPNWVQRRQQLATYFNRALADLDAVRLLSVRPEVSHAYHLYVIELNLDKLSADRLQIFTALRAEGVGVNVHYPPVHLHPFYRERFGTRPGMCPVVETAYQRLVTLPLFPGMSQSDADDVIAACVKVIKCYRK